MSAHRTWPGSGGRIPSPCIASRREPSSGGRELRAPVELAKRLRGGWRAACLLCTTRVAFHSPSVWDHGNGLRVTKYEPHPPPNLVKFLSREIHRGVTPCAVCERERERERWRLISATQLPTANHSSTTSSATSPTATSVRSSAATSAMSGTSTCPSVCSPPSAASSSSSPMAFSRA